jgi:hypothetical protein
MFKVAVRLNEEVLAAAVQLTVLPALVATSHEGAPVTVHEE